MRLLQCLLGVRHLPNGVVLASAQFATGLYRALADVGTLGKGQTCRHRARPLHYWRRRYVFLHLCCPWGVSRTLHSASGIGLVRAFAISPPGEEVYNEEISKWFGIFGGLTCLANLYAVAAIGYKAW